LIKKFTKKEGIPSFDYRYNIHGALTSVNDPSLSANSARNPDDVNTSDGDKFGLTLKYELADQPQYNGNIGSMQWAVAKPTGSSLTSPTLKYDYTYDKLDRLTKAASSTGTTKDENFSEYLSYDKMGNILSLSRWAKLNAGKAQIDDLRYQYNGNQATQVDDASNNNSYGFSDNGSGTISKQANEYAYDLNGNLTKDLNKGVNLITYNNFNLPVQITWGDGRTLVYDYDGNGNKLKKIYTAGGNVFTTDYISELQYEQGQIAFVSTDEGLARKNTSGTNYIYQYFLKDQVGNTRAVIQPVYPAETMADLVQVTNYYPYGLDYRSDDPVTLFSYLYGTKDNYLFNGKELQDGTEMYDFGARNYDPKTGRWNAPDPASQLLDQSPYLAMGNNPVLYTDPDGRVFGWDDLGAAAIGGLYNLASNAIQGNVHSVGSAFSYFGVGLAAGVATYYGGPMAGAAVLGAGNSVVTQGFANGWGHINPGQVATSAAFSVVTSYAGAQFGSQISPYTSGLTSQIASPVLRESLSQGLNNAVVGFGLGAGVSLANGSSVDAAFDAGARGAAEGFATGGVTGAIAGAKYAEDNHLGLWSGRSTDPPLPPAQSAGVASIVTQQHYDGLVKDAQLEYPNKAGKIELHHPTPQYLGGAKNQKLVPLDAAYHQKVTNAFRAEWGYGVGKPSAVQLNLIIKKVYSKYPLPPSH
jgi:RHS repeat-associated protein